MVSSIAEAMKKAQAKKGGKSHPMIHPSFPPQAEAQPSFMGSQSNVPMQGDPMASMGGGPPIDQSGNFGGGY